MLKEIVIISGKGGTGKTSVAASFAYLAENKVIADCDVDAADLHLVLQNTVVQSEDFESGKKAAIDKEICIECGLCLDYCRFYAIDKTFTVDVYACEGCGVCAHFCPQKAITMKDHISGQWYVSDTPYGTLVHAKLGIAEGNSGKLVTLIRKKAKEMAKDKELIIVDGSPGIGCPVIATITGASFVLIVTEPTVAGIHDLKRVYELCRHFRMKTAVCVNKADINPEKTGEIKVFCAENGISMLAGIPYDQDVNRAQIAGKSVAEYSNGSAAETIRSLWLKISDAVR